MAHRVVVPAWAALCLSGALAQPTIHLKARSQGEALFAESYAENAKSLSPQRIHRLVQFPSAPSAAAIDHLKVSGARIVSHVPDHAFLVAVDTGWSGQGLGLIQSAELRSSDKWSPAFDRSRLVSTGPASPGWFLVEFHGDTSAGDNRTIATREGMVIRERPDLLPSHLLLQGTADQARALTRWDEVAYVFPAAADLIRGEPAHACAGALMVSGVVGQSVDRAGEGWDGPGKNAAALTYRIENVAAQLASEPARTEIERALAEWARHVRVTFQSGGSATGSRHLDIRFAAGSHGDPYPFDGRGRVLAHTFYPAPPNPEPLAGDLHFDQDEAWKIGADTDLFSVALHELGHALGLGHSDNPSAVMYAYYRRASALSPDDITAIRELYAAREVDDGAPPPDDPDPPPPGNPPANPPVNPPVNPPANPPANPPTPPANPPSGNDRTAPTLSVTSPSQTSVLTNAATITIRGEASDNVGVDRVAWSSNTGSSGTAEGTREWSASIPLLVGINSITIRAYDAAGNSSWRSLVVTRR